jgi:flagellar hook-length control protein FliK
MVPFSFENITRSAALDTLKALPVSEAARATHESFESHLERAAVSTPNSSTRGTPHDDKTRERPASTTPPRNEPVRQTTKETRRDDDDAREENAADAAATSKSDAADHDQELEQDTIKEDESVVSATIEEQRAAVQELELQTSGDTKDNADDETAGKLANTSLSEEESKLASLVTNAEASDEQAVTEGDGNAADVRRVKRGGEQHEDTKSGPQKQRVAVTETNEEVAARGFRDDGQAPQATNLDDELPRKNATPRRGDLNNIVAELPTDETQNAATRTIDAALVEAASDATGDDNSRQRRNHNDADSTRTIGHAKAIDETATTPGTPSRFAQHLLSKTGDPSARGLNLSDSDQARFVDRVARAVQATGDRGGTLRLRLSPPELGSLTLEIKVQGGAVTARVEADTVGARALLLENLPLLRERLAEQGMRVDQFDVDLTDRQAGETPDGLPRNDHQQEDRPRSKGSSHEPEESPRSKSPGASTAIGNGQLNIIV